MFREPDDLKEILSEPALSQIEDLAGINTMYYNGGVVVQWDVRKANANKKKHGVSFEEGASLFFTGDTVEIEDSRYEEQRFIVIGFSVRARLLTVVYTDRTENEIRIIPARKATKLEGSRYEERI